LKLGGYRQKLWGGGVNMREKQIYIKKHKKTEKNDIELGGGYRFSTGGSIPTLGGGGVKISLNTA